MTVIYNCKHCKRGRRVEYPNKTLGGYTRIDANGKAQPAAVWIQASGGGRPTLFGGDVEMGVCSCGRMMSFGQLKASLRLNHPCDARCLFARGPNCECSCGGANHGCGMPELPQLPFALELAS
jgi:hypothetical protein